MRRFSLLTAVIATLLVSGAPTLAEEHSEAATKAIGEIAASFAQTWKTNDAAALAAFWAEDGDLINPFGQWAKGRAEVEKLFAGEHAGPMKGTTYQLNMEGIRFLGADVAIATWSGTINGMKTPDGGDAPPFEHWVTAVLVLQDGQWRMAAARPMVPLPAPGGAGE